MSDIALLSGITERSTSLPQGKISENESTKIETPNQSNNSSSVENETDPQVCHDPAYKPEGVAKIFADQNKVMMEDGETNEEGSGISANNRFDDSRIFGKEHPIVVINNRDIPAIDIIYMCITYNSFLPKIELKIFDRDLYEVRFKTTQMSSLIRVCMVSNVDKVYRKILLNFKVTSVYVNQNDPTIVSYMGEMYVPGFQETHNKLIVLFPPCPKPITCQQGNFPNANTWEMLHQIAAESGLGFQATKEAKNVLDRVVRHAHHQRYDEFIKEQLEFSGNSENNIFDAWVDLYGYITLIDVAWVLKRDILESDITIINNVGLHGTSNDMMDQKPVKCERTLSDYLYLGAKSNAEVASYYTTTNNSQLYYGTIETVYTQNIGSTRQVISQTDIQTIQRSRDGNTLLNMYNTGNNRPIPIYNFNDDLYTGLKNGYNIGEQRTIRNAFFREKRQTIINVELVSPNFGLQRGTLVTLALFHDSTNPKAKQVAIDNTVNLSSSEPGGNVPNIDMPNEMPKEDVVMDPEVQVPNLKLHGLYYIDGMMWEYSQELGYIRQTIECFKKGPTPNYFGDSYGPRINATDKANTLPATDKIINEQDIV
jgi:hypothetical protein